MMGPEESRVNKKYLIATICMIFVLVTLTLILIFTKSNKPATPKVYFEEELN